MEEKNHNARLEAFCDGVFAIAITLLIIDIKSPSTENITSTADLWMAIQHLAPNIVAFVLSFIVILITWVNHHAALRLVSKSSPQFIFANGLLLLTVVSVPFPTALMGEFVLTQHAAPAVVLYSAVCALQAVSWVLLTKTALHPANPLTKNEKAMLVIRGMLQKAYYAFVLYTVCAVMAFWFPMTIVIVVTITWIAWLVVAITTKME